MTDEGDVGEQAFLACRERLLGVCYRMLGSVADAEDVVQETYLRWRAAGRPELDSAAAWFTRVGSRICLDRLKSAQAKRESYPGEWLPEPFAEPSRSVEIDETISQALLVALERLSPKERASFLLHDVFSYDFAEIAEALDSSPANCRQLASRARRRLRERRPRFTADEGEVRRLNEAFFSAIERGDVEQLRNVLAEDVVLVSDGGGKASAAARPILGRERVHRFLTRLLRAPSSPSSVALRRPVWFNGAPGAVFESERYGASAYQLSITDGAVRAIFVQRNPDKLRRLLVALQERNQSP